MIRHVLPKFRSLKKEGIIKEKFPMSIATMSRQTKRAYLRLCPEKRRKRIQEVKGKENENL